MAARAWQTGRGRGQLARAIVLLGVLLASVGFVVAVSVLQHATTQAAEQTASRYRTVDLRPSVAVVTGQRPMGSVAQGIRSRLDSGASSRVAVLESAKAFLPSAEEARTPEGFRKAVGGSVRAVVIVTDGSAVGSDPIQVAKQLSRAASVYTRAAPGTLLYVIGPSFSRGDGGASLTPTRNALRATSMIVGAEWIDPVKARWLPASDRAAGPIPSTAQSAVISAHVSRIVDAIVAGQEVSR